MLPCHVILPCHLSRHVILNAVKDLFLTETLRGNMGGRCFATLGTTSFSEIIPQTAPPAKPKKPFPPTLREAMADLNMDRAKVAFVQGKFEEAVEAFSKAIEEDPQNAIAFHSRGTARLKLKDFEGSIPDFSECLRLNKANQKAMCSRATAYLALGRLEEAMEDFNRALDVSEFYPNAYFGRAEVFRRLGEKEHARMDMDVGRKIMEKRGQSHFESQGIMFQDPAN